jgi:hypothetical protein
MLALRSGAILSGEKGSTLRHAVGTHGRAVPGV